MKEGAFDDLAGRGQPLNLEEYFSAPEDVRMAYSILKNANCVPAEVQLMNDISRLQHDVAQTPDIPTRESLQRNLLDRQTELAILLERRRIRRRCEQE